MNRRGTSGLTLVEVMLVVLIISLLASVSVPSFARARRRTRAHVCINNLRIIESAKEMYSMEHNLSDGASVGDLLPYFKQSTNPACPASGNYAVGVIGVKASCDIADHVLP